MEKSKSTGSALTISFGQGEARQTVHWPIVKATAKAWLISTAAGEIWMPKYLWLEDRTSHAEIRIRRLMELLTKISSTHPDARVPVKRAGKGSSEKSVRVSYQVRRAAGDPRNPDCKEIARSATVPLSLLAQDTVGTWSMPLWCLKKKLAPSENFATNAKWLGLPVVQAQLEDAHAAAIMLRAEQELQVDADRARARLDGPLCGVTMVIPKAWLVPMGISEQAGREELKTALKAELVHLLMNPLGDAVWAQLEQVAMELEGETERERVSVMLGASAGSMLERLAKRLNLTLGPTAKRLLSLVGRGVLKSSRCHNAGSSPAF